MFAVGQRVSVTIYSAARIEVYEGTIIELFGVATVRVQIDNGGIIRVFQNQIKAL